MVVVEVNGNVALLKSRTILFLPRLCRLPVLLILIVAFLFGCDNFSFYDELESALNTEADPLELNPETAIVGINKQVNFMASGGERPYTYSLFAGSGSIDPESGVFVAPGVSSDIVVVVTDNVGDTDLAAVRAIAPLRISPQSVDLEAVVGIQTFTATYGIAPYTFTLISGAGTITPFFPNTAEYTAPAVPGTAIVEVEDSVGSIKQATVTISPIGALLINPPSESVVVLGTVSFTASGGLGPYFFSLPVGSGSVTPTGPPDTTADYTAPGSAGSATVRVTDSSIPTPQTADATIVIVPLEPLSISPLSIAIKVGGSFTFSASGGLGPYTYAVIDGFGTIDPDTGLYTAVKKNKKDKVQVTDSLGSTDKATVNVKD